MSIDFMLKEFERHLKDGWGIEYSKRLAGITQQLSRKLQVESIEFRIIKDNYKKQFSKHRKSEINMNAEIEKRINVAKDFINKNIQSNVPTTLPLGNENLKSIDSIISS